MRSVALVLAASLLVVGCSESVGGRPETGSSPSSPTPRASPSAPRTTKPAPPQNPPAAGAPISDVIAWIDAGAPADAGQYHSATRDGTVTRLQGDDVAFTTPSGKTTCMTDSMFSDGDLACMVDLVNEPPQPPEAYGQWVPGWISFDGRELSVGTVRGDPERFIYGDGPQLPYGQALKFGDFRCRSDTVGLFCVNYAHQSGARINDAGVEPFGCLRPAPPPEFTGFMFRC